MGFTPVVLVFADGTARHLKGTVRKEAIIHDIVEAIAKQYETLRRLAADYDYTPYVDGKKQHEYYAVGLARFVKVIKIVSKMPNPDRAKRDAPQS